MAQDYTVNAFQSDHVAQTDMTNIEKNLECLRSFFSGASAPSNALAGHVWFDTTNALPRIRNDANNAWIAFLTGTSDQKIWIYRNDTDDGWVVDSSVTDRVLSIKGGSGLYNVNGGNTAGETWTNLKAHTHTGSSHTHNHNHRWYKNNDVDQNDDTFDVDGNDLELTSGNVGDSKTDSVRFIRIYTTTGEDTMPDAWTNDDATSSSSANTGGQSTADVRPAAAVGTLQYPDI